MEQFDHFIIANFALNLMSIEKVKE